jgi:hypothetical protein
MWGRPPPLIVRVRAIDVGSMPQRPKSSKKGSVMISSSAIHKFQAFLALCMLACVPCVASAAPDPTSAKGVVERLYQDYAWVVLFQDSDFVRLADQPEKVLSQYFSPSLSGLVIADHQCVEKTKDICKLDFDPLYDSQDSAGAHDLHVDAMSQANEVQVRFSPRWGSTAVKQLQFKMVKTSAGWRIDDIDYPDHESFRSILQQKKN